MLVDSETTLSHALRQIHSLTNAHCSSISIQPIGFQGHSLTRSLCSGSENKETILPAIQQAASAFIPQIMTMDEARQFDAPSELTGTIIVVPVHHLSEVVGTLTLWWKPPITPMPDKVVLQTFTDIVAQAIITSELYESQQYYIQSLEYLGGLSTELNQYSSIHEIVERAGHTAKVLLNADDFLVLLSDENGVHHKQSSGVSRLLVESLQDDALPEYLLTLSKSAYALEYTASIKIADNKDIPAHWHKILSNENIHATLITIIHSSDRMFGSLWLFYQYDYAATPHDIRLFEILASQTAVALENLELHIVNNRHAQELEKAVKERTSELAIALDQAQDADRLKTQLLSTVSHELRTPLAVIKAHSSTLLMYFDRLPKERHVQYLKTMNQETDRLNDLISSLLEMSRLEAGLLDIHLSPFIPYEMFEGITQGVKTRFPDRPIEMAVPRISKPILADPERLRQVISNLIENALKYSPDGSPLEIGARLWDDGIEIWVKDQGKGLTPEQAQHVFDRFYQVDSLDPKTARAGVGLGLSICKGLVEGMGGRIWCESKGSNMGSRFAFTLPWANANIENPDNSMSQDADSQAINVS